MSSEQLEKLLCELKPLSEAVALARKQLPNDVPEKELSNIRYLIELHAIAMDCKVAKEQLRDALSSGDLIAGYRGVETSSVVRDRIVGLDEKAPNGLEIYELPGVRTYSKRLW